MTPKHLRMQIKQLAADGSFDGLLAVYNNVDLGGELIEPGAFTKSIKENGDTVPMLWQHKSDTPIGMLTLIDGPDGLHVRGQLLMEVPAARTAYLLIKARIVRGLSIGFDTVKDAVDGTVRRLKEIRLWEGSIVTFPMNELAIITSVKAREEAKEDFNTEYAEIQLQDAMYQMWIALRCALSSIPWSDLAREEKIAASAASIEQFTTVYMEFIPAYLDWLTTEYGEFSMMGRSPAEIKARRIKAGKVISAATRKKLATAQSHTKSADDLLVALLADEADVEDDATSEGKAATGTEHEPVLPSEGHSAASQILIDNIRSLIPPA